MRNNKALQFERRQNRHAKYWNYGVFVAAYCYVNPFTYSFFKLVQFGSRLKSIKR